MMGMSDRSYENYKPGQQLYSVIEFCNDAGTLWGKLASHKWDWLGVHKSGKFVLGRPALTDRLQARAQGQIAKRGDADGSTDTSIGRPLTPIPMRPGTRQPRKLVLPIGASSKSAAAPPSPAPGCGE